MTPEQQEELKRCLQTIAQILYQESDPEDMKTLEGIEVTLRQQIQKHVSPELAFFLSKLLQAQKRVKPDTSKVL